MKLAFAKPRKFKSKNKILVLNGEVMRIQNLLLTANQDAMVTAIQNNSQKIQTVSQEVASIWNIIYPVGSYYETSNPNFNPNSSWGGIWEKDTDGYVTVGGLSGVVEDPTSTSDKLNLGVGQKYGETKHTLTINEMPSHQHKLNSSGGDTMAVMTNRVQANDVDQHGGGIWTYDQVSMYTNWVGDSQSHNNVQPSIGVYRWHRTA